MIGTDLSIILPEIVLAVFAMLALVVAVYTRKDALAPVMVWATAGIFVALALWIAGGGNATKVAFGGSFIDDGFARFAKVMILV
jgi:NADH-quinone oxidoreductase subunit N